MEPENGTCSPLSNHFSFTSFLPVLRLILISIKKEISQNRILHHARKPLDGDDCLVVFINRISMLH